MDVAAAKLPPKKRLTVLSILESMRVASLELSTMLTMLLLRRIMTLPLVMETGAAGLLQVTVTGRCH